MMGVLLDGDHGGCICHDFKLKNHIPKYELIEKYKSIQMLLTPEVKK